MFASKDLMFGQQSGGYQISRSVRMRSSASAYLTRTPASAGSLTTWTWSGWIKRGTLGTSQAIFSSGTSNITLVHFQADNTLRIRNSTVEYVTTQVFRDPSAWYHIVLQWNTTNGTAADRVLLYVNGVQVTSFSTQTTASPSEQSEWNKAQANNIGRYAFNGTLYFDGYMTEINFIDGQALTPTSFGATDAVTGVWNPIRYNGTYGTNGFYLNFSDNTSPPSATTIGKDSSGNGNNWTPTQISLTTGTTYDSMVDTPTNYGIDTGAGGEVRGNYCTLNPLNVLATQVATINNGNLNFSDSTSGNRWVSSTMSSTTGKWYFELTCLNTGTFLLSLAPGLVDGAFYRNNGTYSSSFGGGGTSGYSSWTTNDVIGCAFDADAGKVWFGKQTGGTGSMVWQGTGANPATGTNPTNTFTANLLVFAAIYTDNSAGTKAGAFNFGQRAFSATAPSGFKAMCTQNLSASSVTTSGSFTGNASADGPFVWLNGVPTAMTINGNAVTFGTHADKLANGFKVRTTSSSYNTAGSNTYSITSNGAIFKYQRAQTNP